MNHLTMAPVPPPGLAEYMRRDEQRRVAMLTADEARRRPAQVINASALMRNHPNLKRQIVEGVLRQAEILNAVSASKIGKTTLVHPLAISVALGEPWLDRYATEQCRVLLIDNELHSETLAFRLRTTCERMGVSPEDLQGRLDVLPVRGRSFDVHQLGRYLASPETPSYGLVVIDSFYRALPAGTDENSNGDIRDVFNALDGIAETTGAAFILIHHQSKGDQSGKSVTDVGSGAGAFSRAADAHLILRVHEEDTEQSRCVVMEGAMRSQKPIEPIGLRLDWPIWRVDLSLDVTALKGVRKPKSASAPAEVPDRSPAAFVKAFVTATAHPKSTITARAQASGWGTREASRAFDMALADGLIKQAPGGDKRRPLFTVSNPEMYCAHTPHTPRVNRDDDSTGRGFARVNEIPPFADH